MLPKTIFESPTHVCTPTVTAYEYTVVAPENSPPIEDKLAPIATRLPSPESEISDPNCSPATSPTSSYPINPQFEPFQSYPLACPIPN